MEYTGQRIAAVCKGRHYGADRDVRSVVTDSRGCVPEASAMFVAMRGEHHDSHEFIPRMYERGIRTFMVERTMEPVAEDCSYIEVDNAIEALQRLAADYRSHFGGEVVGITGSNGKTVVKEWIAQTAPEGIRLFRSPRSYNSQLGVALSLLMMRGDEDMALIEAGISQRGEMARLEKMIRPDTVIITSIGDAHQENFDSEAEKLAEKMILAKNARRVICNSAYESVARAVGALPCEVFDAARCSDITLADDASTSNARITAAFWLAERNFRCDLSRLQPVAMRLEVKEGIADSLIIDDTYNSDINSLAIALDYLHSAAAERPRIVIMSDILQSGLDEATLYGRAAEMIGKAGVERVVGIGSAVARYKSSFPPQSEFYPATQDFLRDMDASAMAGHAILLKGSRSMRFEQISHRLERKSHTTVLEVDLDAMTHNLNYFRSRLRAGTRLTAMVKAASYGAGDMEVAQLLQNQGVTYLAVAFADEGVLLRRRGITMPIVVLNADEGSFDQMILHRLEPEIYSFASLDSFAATARAFGERQYPVHLKLDTGMHRLGFVEEQIDDLLAAADRYADTLRVASVFAHLCVADEPQQDDFTRLQIERFRSMSGRIAEHLPYGILRHTANSAAIERFPEAQFDMCRLGLGLYGFGFEHNPALRPVSTLKTRIVQLKRLAAGETVGYGRAGILSRDSVTATVPIGYADGLDRHLGCGAWSMIVRGGKAPIVGRVCMDSCMIDVTDIEGVAEGDEVTVFSAEEGNTAEDMARILGTIPYEILTSVSSRVKRIYTKE